MESPEIKFLVIHGRHRCLALKKLQAQKKLSSVLTVEEGNVAVFILATNNVSFSGHLLLKGNDVAAKFAAKPTVIDVAKLSKCLRGQIPAAEAEEAALRYCRTLKFARKECESVKRFCKWDLDQMEKGLEIIEKYETFLTKDAQENLSKSTSMMKQGKKNYMTQV